MEQITQTLLSIDWLPVWTSVALFLAIVLVVTGASSLVNDRRMIARRLADGAEAARSPVVRSADIGPRQRGGITLEDGFLQRFDRIVSPSDEKELSAIRKRLIRGGFRKQSAVRVYYASRAVLAIGAAVISSMCVAVFLSRSPIPLMLLVVLGATLVGFLTPTLWVERCVQRRREEAQLSFPDALDMILVCVEAGHGIDQALRRVAKEFATTSAVLAEEFAIIGDELRAGKERARVLRDFAERVNVDDISAFVTILNQSEDFGVSIADALRVYASEMRNKRVMRAEEKANVMPVKLALGTIAFTVPPVILILSGPSVIMIMRSFASMAR